jgi:hypothetical protein
MKSTLSKIVRMANPDDLTGKNKKEFGRAVAATALARLTDALDEDMTDGKISLMAFINSRSRHVN